MKPNMNTLIQRGIISIRPCLKCLSDGFKTAFSLMHIKRPSERDFIFFGMLGTTSEETHSVYRNPAHSHPFPWPNQLSRFHSWRKSTVGMPGPCSPQNSRLLKALSDIETGRLSHQCSDYFRLHQTVISKLCFSILSLLVLHKVSVCHFYAWRKGSMVDFFGSGFDASCTLI